MERQHSAMYNDLMDVADASAKVEQLGGDAFVGQFLTMIADEGLGDLVGIRLLHKHNNIKDDEVMCESVRHDDVGFALVTSAVNKNQALDSVPNSWRVTGSHAVPVEFSDRGVVIADVPAERLSPLFGKLGVALRGAGAADVLGPCINYSPDVTTHAPNANSAFLEKTERSTRSNVVRYIDRGTIDFSMSVKTKWLAIRATNNESDQQWITACTCYCSVFPGGGHQGTTYHRLQNRDGSVGPLTERDRSANQ